MHSEYCTLLRRLARDEQVWQSERIRSLPLTQQQVRMNANATDGPISEDLLHTAAVRACHQTPDHPAVISAERTLTYGQLSREAGALSSILQQLGACPNQPVAVITEPGCERVVAVFGTLDAGAAYVPIDPELPDKRFQLMLVNADARIAITTSELDAALMWPGHIHRVVLDQLPDDPSAALNIQSIQSQKDLAYIIYTSGSTGQPKGVMIDHRGAVNTVADM